PGAVTVRGGPADGGGTRGTPSSGDRPSVARPPPLGDGAARRSPLEAVGEGVAGSDGCGGECGDGVRGGAKAAQRVPGRCDRCAQRSQARGVNPDVWVHGTPRGRASITCRSEHFTRRSDGKVPVCV